MLLGVEVSCTLDNRCRFLDDRLKCWPDCSVRGECCRGHNNENTALWQTSREFIEERRVETSDWKGQVKLRCGG